MANVAAEGETLAEDALLCVCPAELTTVLGEDGEILSCDAPVVEPEPEPEPEPAEPEAVEEAPAESVEQAPVEEPAEEAPARKRRRGRL